MFSRGKEWPLNELVAVERRYALLKFELDRAQERNRLLEETLKEAREQIVALREEVEKLTAPPNQYGTFLRGLPEGLADILMDGRRFRVHLSPSIKPGQLQLGQQVLVNEAFNVIEVADNDTRGDVAKIKDLLGEDRALVVGHGDEEHVVHLAAGLAAEGLQVGDVLLLEARSGVALEKLPKSEATETALEEVPDIDYSAIGGLGPQIEELRDAIELPYLYPDLFAEHRLLPPKGILLYGPPGCGKTLIAKAVANSLAKKVEERTGQRTTGFFLNIKGPELLNKYVGETERKIREIFQKARTLGNQGHPVIVFFDEMDSLFRQRGTGISSDVETTTVAQFLTELDGVESLRNVIVIGASNRQDLIDPAVLRPGRLDLKIQVARPDQEAAREIFSKYLGPDLPFHPEELARHEGDPAATATALIGTAAEAMFAESPENRFIEVTYAHGDKEVFYFKDFASGAMIEAIVSRAKARAVKRLITTGEKGLRTEDLVEAIGAEYRENEDLPNTANPDDWAKIAGKKGERILNVRPLHHAAPKPARPIETISGGQYL
ncbi:MAG: proteasome ATPase [Deltaproteobacteria bacterium]|nr:proteasome ATPase [Deltaproteobacteria bacterium]